MQYKKYVFKLHYIEHELHFMYIYNNHFENSGLRYVFENIPLLYTNRDQL